ncbi:MAG: HAD family hydrolase [Planctomycetota bacterium]
MTGPALKGRGVIFDMDGVLLLSARAHWKAWRAAAAARGVELTRQQFLSFNGFTNADICARLFPGETDAAFVAKVAAEKELAFRAAIEGAVPLAPGCLELLAALRDAGARLALGTSAPAGNADLVLDEGGLRGFFDAAVHADMVARGKPAPDIFLLASDLLRVPPDRCLVVEDAPSGIRAARAAGMRALGITTNHRAEELIAEGAVATFAGVHELSADRVCSAFAGLSP